LDYCDKLAVDKVDTDSHSKIEQGDDEKPTQAYIKYVEECDEEATKLYE
jgi:hypothetical protein